MRMLPELQFEFQRQCTELVVIFHNPTSRPLTGNGAGH
jgi:hypothetical protein